MAWNINAMMSTNDQNTDNPKTDIISVNIFLDNCCLNNIPLSISNYIKLESKSVFIFK